MKFISLTDPTDVVSFEEALFKSIANDGGLYVPADIPQLSVSDIQQLTGATRQEAAQLILNKWLGDEIPVADLEMIIDRASTFETPLVPVGDKVILELFHGPTLAFKDVAAGYLAAIVSYFNQKRGRHSTILVATSGDTGGAIAHGFGDVDQIDVVVLYPKDRVSTLQKEQLRRVASNVHTVEVAGSFDDCQAMVKQALADPELSSSMNLMSANSINVGRLLPQSTYYAYAYGQLTDRTGRFVVPSGNLGNITGGSLALAMGVPIPGFLAANNVNNTFARYIQSGSYQPEKSIQTFSNAMDVVAPNNLPRLIQLFTREKGVALAHFQAATVTDDETTQTIKQVYQDTGYLLDPHTAVAWCASEKVKSPVSYPDIIVSTASPLKFANEIHEKTGIEVDNSKLLQTLRLRAERYSEITNSVHEFKEYLKDNISINPRTSIAPVDTKPIQ